MDQPLPLAHVKVVEMSHMVMGPTVGLVLGDLGADVVKIEPLGGDKTRRLRGSGAGYFVTYNRNKRSLCLDTSHEEARELLLRLVADADVFVENFRPGAMDRLGLGWEALSALNPRLVYCSTRGFLEGPYQHRTALDEVAQMMGGLAYMTGPPGRPLRAGASVIDVTGGMFGAIGVMAALEQRHRTGKGGRVISALYECTAFLVGQHMAQYAVTGTPAPPMPARISAWAVYDIFDTVDGEQVFVAVVSDTQWPVFCREFGFADWAVDATLAANGGRVARRDVIIPALRERLGACTKADLMARLERCGLPYAPIARPEELFDDIHLNASGGLLPIDLPEGGQTRLPALPVSLDGQRFGVHHPVPTPGRDTRAVLRSLGLPESAIDSLVARGVIG
ncbi:MAG: CaiB/BaiF CoA transferase family protein [Gammaproteobacteria bacterium]